MRIAAGQAARLTGRRLGWLAQIALALVVLLLAAVGVLAWRLDQGPLDLPWLAHRIERFACGRGIDLTVGQASLAWAGFSRGLGQPLRVALTDLRAAGPNLAAARVAAAFAIGPLLEGRFVPDGIAVDGVRVVLTRDAQGTLMLGTQPAPGPAIGKMFGRAAHPPAGAGAGQPARKLDWRALHHLHLHDVAASLYDAQIGVAWRIDRADADLDRAADGTVGGRATVAVQAGAQRATLTLTAQQRADRSGSDVRAVLTPLDPASVAGLAPAFAALAALDAPVGLSGTIDLDPAFRLRHAHLQAQIGAGTVHAGVGAAPLLAAVLTADATPTTLDGTQRLETAPAVDGPHTVVTGTLHAGRTAAGWQATEVAELDRIAFADLPALWPPGVGGPGTRPWITHNIPSGELTGGHLSMTLAIPPDFSDARLTAIDGAIDGHDLTVDWLRPVPPIEHAEGRLTITTPDVIDIAISSARQARPPQSGPPPDGIAFSKGLVHLTGIAGSDQFADISTDLSGTVPDLIAVLKNPKIKLLDKRPIPMRDPAGQFSAHLAVAHLPLRDDVALEDLAISTKVRFTGVHLGGIAAGRDLDHGNLDLTADNNGLHAAGTATLAGIASQLQVALDFRAGPPSQIEQQVSVRATIDAAQLASLGLPTRGIVGGSITAQATLRDRRDGKSDIQAHADLTGASIDAARLGYAKAQGSAIAADLQVSLDHGRLVEVQRVAVKGPGVDIEGGAEFSAGKPQMLRLSRIVLAPDTDLRGSVQLPKGEGDPYVVNLAGASLDATGVLKASADAKPRQKPARPAAGAPWVLDAQVGKVVLGPGRLVRGVAAHVENDGRIVRAAQVSGIAQSAAPAGAKQTPAPFRLSIVPERGGRRLRASAPDAGGLLRVLDVADDVSGGRMTIAARYDDTRDSHPLSGTAELHDFRVLNAPVIGRVLQAATLYGLIEVLRGPGLGFTTMIAPFRWQGDTLSLSSARAFSASLGFTAKGSVDLGANTLDMQGTIVPAYFFNTLPGRIPLVGKLFSPERGGGLFAATYAVRGSFGNPKVSVNPLATLTPGFLRGLFGMFGGAAKGR